MIGLGLGLNSLRRSQASTPTTTDFVLWFGDSRTGYSDQANTTTNARVKVYQDSTDSIITAQDPLEHISYATAKKGPMVEFGKLYTATSNRDLVIIPAGQGGSGFQNGNWLTGGSLYTEAVQRCNSAYEKISGAKNWIGIFGTIGTNNTGTVDYISKLSDIFVRFKQDINGMSGNEPCLLMPLQPDFLSAANTNGRKGIEAIIQDFKRTKQYGWVLDLTSVRSNNDVLYNGDTTHDYDADVIAQQMISKLPTAIANVTPSGSTLKPQIFHTPALSRSLLVLTASVPYSPIFYDPQPNDQRWDWYKADAITVDAYGNASGVTNEVLLQQDTVTLDDTSQTYTIPPTQDNKYYYAKLVGVNANGTSEFNTTNPYLHS